MKPFKDVIVEKSIFISFLLVILFAYSAISA